MDLESFGIKAEIGNSRHERLKNGDKKACEEFAQKIFDKAGIKGELEGSEACARVLNEAEFSAFTADDEKMLELADEMFSKLEEVGEPFSEFEKAVVRYGIVFADIGKTGPVGTSPEDQRNLMEMFNVEGLPTGQITVEEFIETYIAPEKKEACRKTLLKIGFPPPDKTTMTDFWNAHGKWMWEILKNDSLIPKEFTPGAIFHQILERVNEDLLDGERLKGDFGGNDKFDRAEMLVILIDKYNACHNRSKIPHSKTIEILKIQVAKSAYAGNEKFLHLINLLDEVGDSASFER